jgi:septum formation protein
VDEDAVIARLGEHAGPAAVVNALAEAKARAVAADLDDGVAADCVVIGCDSMLFTGERLCGKPGTAERARAQWESMAGTEGRLFTGHCVLRMLGGRLCDTASAAAVTTVRFATPGPAELDAYLASGEPLEVAGGFTIDGLGGWFLDGVDGDPANVVGLGLSVTRRLLDSVGVGVADLWAGNPRT